MGKNIRTVIFIIIGVVSIGLSIKCFSFKELDYETKSMYGGDAFTGIQNAGAQTSENVKDLANIVKFGFGSVLLVAGLGFLGIGLTTPVTKREQEDNTQEDTPSEKLPEPEKPEKPEKAEESAMETNAREDVKE